VTPRKKYVVTREASRDFRKVRVYRVRLAGSEEWTGFDVWIQPDGSGNCTDCSGPLQAMLSSCPHVAAVKRFIARESR
jgi:hypothetical protein